VIEPPTDEMSIFNHCAKNLLIASIHGKLDEIKNKRKSKQTRKGLKKRDKDEEIE